MKTKAKSSAKRAKSSQSHRPSRSPKSRVLPETKSIAEYKNPLRQYHPATSVILAGYRSGLSEYSVKPPLFRTSTFEFPNAREGEKFFKRAYHLKGNDGQEPGLIYSRLNNPNIEICEDKLVAAEKGAHHALLFPSGMSAITTTILALLARGSKIAYTDPVYGGSYFFFEEFCPKRFLIETHAVDTKNTKLLEKHIKSLGRLDLFYIETPANPTMNLVDIPGTIKLVKKYNPHCLIAVDNTFLGPVFQSPFDFDVDLVFYSATKFLGGHSDLIAGVTLFRNKEHYHAVRDFRTILGATPAPDTAWLLTRSIETLWVRMERQAEKAEKVTKALWQHPKIKHIYYPELLKSLASKNPYYRDQYRIYSQQCRGAGSMFSFELKDNTREAAYRFLDHLKIFHLAVSLGGTESLIEHPRSMTHSDMSIEHLDRAGITEGMIRVSVGLESSEDLIQDILQALDYV